jgi:hypothetical protein
MKKGSSSISLFHKICGVRGMDGGCIGKIFLMEIIHLSYIGYYPSVKARKQLSAQFNLCFMQFLFINLFIFQYTHINVDK